MWQGKVDIHYQGGARGKSRMYEGPLRTYDKLPTTRSPTTTRCTEIYEFLRTWTRRTTKVSEQVAGDWSTMRNRPSCHCKIMAGEKKKTSTNFGDAE